MRQADRGRIMYQVVQLSVGSAAFLVEVSGASGRWQTLKTLSGVISHRRLTAGVDVESFVRAIWDQIDGGGRMRIVVVMACGVVVRIGSTKAGGSVVVTSFEPDKEVRPAGFTGEFVDKLGVRCG